MSVQCAARFTPPPPAEPVIAGKTTGPHPGASAQSRLGAGAVLLLSGGAAAGAWCLPAAAHAQTEQRAPDEHLEATGDLRQPTSDTSIPVSPLWSAPAEADIAGAAPTAAASPAVGPAGSAPLAAAPTGSAPRGTAPEEGAPRGTAPVESAPRGTAPDTTPAPTPTPTPEAAPSRALPAASASAAPALQAPAARERIQDRLAQSTLILRSGKSLWSLTGELLGPDASAAEIARSWPLLWEANADQIRDPDRVAAGTVLQVPPRLLPEQ